MNHIEEMLEQIKILSSSVTEETYGTKLEQGYDLLVKLHDLGVDKDAVYQPLLAYHSSLEDGMAYDYIADILDYVVGWCAPHRSIWGMDV